MLDLAERRPRQIGNEDNLARNLVARELRLEMRPQFVRSELAAGSRNDIGDRHLVPARVGPADHGAFADIGMFEQNAVEAHLANLHCNLTSNVWLSHYFYERLLAKQLRGCIVFTSSSASYIPNPFAVMYGATKSGVSAFAASLACEARPRGIHVHSIHPSPVNSRFTAGGGNQVQQRKIAAMDSFYAFASGPEAVPLKFISHIGRGAVVADIGGVSVGLRLVVHLLGYNFMALMTACTAHLTPDYQTHVGKAKKA